MSIFVQPALSNALRPNPVPCDGVVRAYLHYEVCEEGWSKGLRRSPPYQWIYQSGRIPPSGRILASGWLISPHAVAVTVLDLCGRWIPCGRDMT